jgi:PAS domain S-box-containing protein
VTGKSHYEVFPEIPDRWREVHRKGLRGEVLKADEDPFERADGTTQWVKWEVRPWQNDGGDVGGIVIFAEEITQRKRAEQARLDALRLKQIITDNATTGIIMQDGTGRCTFVNPAAEQMTGFTFEELKGKNVHHAIHHRRPDGRPFPMAECEIGKAVMAMRPIRRHEDVFVRRDGTFYPVICNASPVQQGGVPTEVVLEFRDITEEKEAEQALRENEERMRSVVSHVVDGIITIDEHGTITTYNPAAARMFGYERPEVIGRNVKMLMPEPYRLQHDDYIGNYLRTGRAKIIGGGREVVGRRKDGATFPVELAISEFRLGDRRYFTGIVRDITERKRAEEAPRTVSGELELVLTTTATGHTHCSKDLRHVSANPAYARIAGLPVEEIVGRPIADVMGQEAFRAIRPHIERVLRGERVEYKAEVPFAARGGCYLHVVYVPERDARGEVAGWVSSVPDVTERRQMEEPLRQSEACFRQLADMMPQLAWMARPDGHIAWYNKRWYEYTGAAFEQTEGWGWQSLHDPEELPKVLERWKASIATGEPFDMVFPLRGKDGRFRPFLTRVMALKDEEGRILHWFGTNTDVSEIKEKEDALRESDRRKDEFLAMLGHELRNPLAAILNGLHILLLSKGGDGALVQVKAMMEKQVNNLTRMVDDLLDVSRTTRGKIQLRKEKVTLAALLNHAVESVRPLIEAQRHTFTILPAPRPIRVEADPTRLEQVFVNLLANAAKYTKQGGCITVPVERNNDDAVVRVRDNGVGIRPDLLSKMFDLFVQSERSLDRSEGSLGIGLTLVRKLVEMHGGGVEAYSEGLDKGSEFMVRPPALPPEQDPEAAPEAAADDGKSRVLVVEDAEDVAKTLRLLLEIWGYDVRVVEDGPSAKVAFRTYQPDIVLLDIGLPGMNGYDVARQHRREPGRKRPFIMAVTGYGQEEDRQRSREAGLDYHMTKPVDPDGLRSLLSSGPSSVGGRA